MKLETFLELAVKSGLRVELRSPTGKVLASMPAADLAADQWAEFARGDAAGLPRKASTYDYDYEAKAEATAERGPAALVCTVRLHGGVDVSSESSDVTPMPVVKDSATALGHLVKSNEAMAKQVVSLAARLADRERDELKELREMARDAMQHARMLLRQVQGLQTKIGEGDVVVQIAKAQADADARRSVGWANALREVAPVGAAVLAPLLPEGARDKVGRGVLLATLRGDQLEAIYGLLGPKRASALLTAKTRDEMFAAFAAIDGDAELPKLLDGLDVAQRAMVNKMLDEVIKAASEQAKGEPAAEAAQ